MEEKHNLFNSRRRALQSLCVENVLTKSLHVPCALFILDWQSEQRLLLPILGIVSYFEVGVFYCFFILGGDWGADSM